ncbi:adenylyl-sulfate kinase (plasmid) [Rhizobium sp. CB3171]|uniref:adenylyl-sulfate kinase n=1 Tax=Rhizobium sp. CB3171 TaxID=3039157 RepID=UPI0024B14E49|nr:adenylyl-sulfate kinase [Rhizobium sp. CB3171]WFU05941.1 adenylyl-sulfate kinase [Rhizobium sp. CB3171]
MQRKLCKAAESVERTGELFEQFQQKNKGLLRFITCGGVDDGKTTLIGRLLWETKEAFEDQIEAVKSDSRRHGSQGGEMDFALPIDDGLSAEREQGITIDVAYRYFATPKRKFIAADTPGHEQYTHNMVAAASSADAAILLVDARKGLQTQTRRHAYLAALVGVRHVVLAINKMDMVEFNKDIYKSLSEEMNSLAKKLDFETVSAIPLSALKGDNVTVRSSHMSWYGGETLLGYLETVMPSQRSIKRVTMPVQWINRPNSNFRGISGTVSGGPLSVNDEIRVTPSGQTAKVAEIVTMDGSLSIAEEGSAVTLKLNREIGVSRGDVISLAQHPIELTEHFEATIVWMHEDPGLAGRSYDVKLATQWASASITTIKYRINVNTLAHEAGYTLRLNDIAVCNISLSRPLSFDLYENSKLPGGFILVDRLSNATVAAGMIRHDLRRGQNVHRQALSITRASRERLNGHGGKVVWFTGLSGSGKSTIANALEIELHARGKRTYILDGDNVRLGLNKDLGFTDADRVENIRRIAEVAKLMMDAGLIVLTAFISPFRREREMARDLIGLENFLEIYVNTPLDVCERRDPKGLYRKARTGLLPNMTGINSPYEEPTSPDLVVGGEGQSVSDAVTMAIGLIE